MLSPHEKANKQRIKLKNRRRKAILNALGGVCCSCWEYDPDCLDVHHAIKFREFKKFDISANSLSKPLEEIEDELSICFLLCTNCHRKVHKGKIEEPKFRKRKIQIKGKWRTLWKE